MVFVGAALCGRPYRILVVRVPFPGLHPAAAALQGHLDLVPAPVALGVGRVVAEGVLLAQLLEDVAEGALQLLDAVDLENPATALPDRLLQLGVLAVVPLEVPPGGGERLVLAAELDPLDQRLAGAGLPEHLLDGQDPLSV